MIKTHFEYPCKFLTRMDLEVQVDQVVQVAHHSLFLVDQVAPEGQ